MEFEVGKLYISKDKVVIVKCTNPTGCNGVSFEGVVVNDNGSCSRGTSSDEWSKPYFKEYHELKETVITLQNGHKYNIPKGCKATVTGDVIEIEEDVRYFYHKNNGCTGYYKNMTDTTMEVAFYDDGDISISISTSNIFDWSERSTKEEFETAYNKATEVLKP